MSYEGSGESSGTIVTAGSVETVPIRLSTARFVATGSLTDGRFGLFRWDMQPKAGGPGPHFHRTFAESFFILSGTVRLYDGRAWADGYEGDFFHVPDGGIHAFRNDARAPASMLILFAPAPPREAYFSELSEIASSGRTLTPEEWTELYARHDQVMVTARE
jgi:quercetin dioxygenase-like cupin family protein